MGVVARHLGAILVRITAAGMAAVDGIVPRRLAIEGGVLDALEPNQRTEIMDALDLLARTLEKAARRTD